MGGMGVRWVVAKAEINKQDDTNSRIWSSYGMYMYPRSANIQQGLERCELIVGAISVPPAKLVLSFNTISPVMDLHGWQKALWKSRPIKISRQKQ